jgi:hypothetical protein
LIAEHGPQVDAGLAREECGSRFAISVTFPFLFATRT